MQTQALFDDIPTHIMHGLRQAQHSIYVAVAWFTRADFFEILLQKARSGVSVQLALSGDHINRTAPIRHDELGHHPDCHTYWVGDGESNLMHHKFCVIDEQTVITGSFNWSKKAETHNHENITISHDGTLARAFIAEFCRLTGAVPRTAAALPIDKIIKRLEILKTTSSWKT